MNDQLPVDKKKNCSVCGEPATDIICPPCQAKIHGEAAHRKQQIEQEVRTDTGRKSCCAIALLKTNQSASGKGS